MDPQRARAAVVAHHQTLAHPGDSFLPSMQLAGRSAEIMINGTSVGVVTVADGVLVLCTLYREAKKYDRQVVELAIRSFEATKAFAASWDGHHIELFGAFARETASQAYQLELLDPDHLVLPADPVGEVTLAVATEADLPYLTGVDFIDDYTEPLAAGRVRIARRNSVPVGIGLVAPHPLNETVVDLGMFTDPTVRRQGVGRTIIALSARECLDRGQTPVAGCWYANWPSRPTLEAAGLTCVGTIFNFTLDPDTFR
jgi:hypothetical protein